MSTATNVIEAEATEVARHEPATDLAVSETHHNAIRLGAVGGDTGLAVIESAVAEANRLRDIIEQRKLFVVIQNKKYVKVEGWTTLATIMGCLPAEVSTTYDPDWKAFVSVVELRHINTGAVLGRASAECGSDDDRPWNRRPRPACRSMAQTRATSKACRMAFSWVMTLAGYETTPAEEMSYDEHTPADTGARTHSSAPITVINTIDDEQTANITALIDECETTPAARDKLTMTICRHYQADSIDMLDKGYYDVVARNLEKRRATPVEQRK